jgi:hypothetical protein
MEIDCSCGFPVAFCTLRIGGADVDHDLSGSGGRFGQRDATHDQILEVFGQARYFFGDVSVTQFVEVFGTLRAGWRAQRHRVGCKLTISLRAASSGEED